MHMGKSTYFFDADGNFACKVNLHWNVEVVDAYVTLHPPMRRILKRYAPHTHKQTHARAHTHTDNYNLVEGFD